MKKKYLIYSAISLIALILICFIFLQSKHNFHTVIPQTVYRSAQLQNKVLAKKISDHAIQSVINLRGEHETLDWYKKESALIRKKNLTLYNIDDIPVHNYPTTDRLKTLVATLQRARLPLLIHCKNGSDRTGLASAIILILHNASLATAEKQISWRFLAFSPYSVGKLVFKRYSTWLEHGQKKHSRQNFIFWVQHQYNK